MRTRPLINSFFVIFTFFMIVILILFLRSKTSYLDFFPTLETKYNAIIVELSLFCFGVYLLVRRK